MNEGDDGGVSGGGGEGGLCGDEILLSLEVEGEVSTAVFLGELDDAKVIVLSTLEAQRDQQRASGLAGAGMPQVADVLVFVCVCVCVTLTAVSSACMATCMSISLPLLDSIR